MNLTEAVIKVANAIKGINPKLKSMQSDINTLKRQNPINANIGSGHPLDGAYADTSVIIRPANDNKFIVTSSWGKWIRVARLDINKAGRYTFSLLTDRNVSRVAFYADGTYHECYHTPVMGLKLFKTTFDASKIQAHMYIEATNGEIYDYKLEESPVSTLSQTQIHNSVIQNMMTRLEALEKKR